jgi:hypothetical protein
MRQNILDWNCFLELFQAVTDLVPSVNPAAFGPIREKGKEKASFLPAMRTARQLIGKISQAPFDPLVERPGDPPGRRANWWLV